MTNQSPKGVNLLKELLFEREARRLEDLGRRLEAETERTQKQHTEMSGRVEAVFQRAGTEDKLLHSVAGIIDGALREAEVARHDDLSRAIAPLVVKTIKHELKENQDEMVEALFPITGRMVKSYVQAAINDLMVKINAQLGGSRPAALAKRSAATGVTPAELALADANKLKIEELFLVKRSSGELIAHWMRAANSDAEKLARTTKPHGNRDVLIAGYLSGIMSLSEEAFGARPGSFRTLSLENGERIFVRGSAAHLLAVRCEGCAPAEVEQAIDEVFLDILERYQKVLAAQASQKRVTTPESATGQDADIEKILPDVMRQMDARTAEKRNTLMRKQMSAIVADEAGLLSLQKPSFARLYAIAAALVLPLIAYGVYSIYQTFQTMVTESAAQRVLASTEDIAGMPPRVEVARGGQSLTISGFVPSAVLREKIIRRLREEVPQASVRNQLAVMPSGAEDAVAALRRDFEREQAEAATAAVSRAMIRASQRLVSIRSDVERLAKLANDSTQPALTALQRSLDDAAVLTADALTVTSKQGARSAEAVKALGAMAQKINAAESQMATLLGTVALPTMPPADTADAMALGDEAAAAVERLSATELSLAHALAFRPMPQQVATLAGKVERLRPRSSREELDDLVRGTAVFFDNGAEFRDATAVNAALDRLAGGMRENAEVVLRVVGYTDERGGSAINSGLAQLRADRAVEALGSRGIAANRLVAVGRLVGKDLTRTTGVGSANRRVEFEIGFPGEAGGP